MANISVDISRPDDEPPPPPAQRHPNTCPVCSSHYRDDELRALLRVCGQCGYHFPVGARERVEQLTDAATFLEIDADLRSADPLAFVDLKAYTDRLSAAELETGLGDAVVVGTAVIRGHPAVLAVMDFGFMGGSMGSVVGEKFARACDLALMHDVPLISVAASGGARMQENILALMQMAKTVAGIDALQEAGVPFISILTHPTTGGVIASFAALGDVALAEPGALMSFAGPRVVQQTTRETLPDDFGLAEANLRLGHIDMVVPRPQLAETLGRLLGVLGGQPGPVEPPALESPAANGGSHGRLGLGRLRTLWRRKDADEDGADGQG